MYPAHAGFGGYEISGVGREIQRQMLEHCSPTKCLLVSYDQKPMGFFSSRGVNMSGPGSAVAATTHAIDLIEKLKARFGPLMFVQSGRRCDGSVPICFQEGDFLLGPGDLLLGEIAGCPFYVDQELYERWGTPRLLIDCVPDGGSSFSLEGMLDMHFITRAQSVVTPRQSRR